MEVPQHSVNTKDAYNRIAEAWVKDLDKSEWGKPGADKFMSFLSKGSTILDVGCGGGTKTHYIASHGYIASGIDFSEKMIEIAKRDFPNLEFHVMDMYDIDKYPKPVDGIFMQAALLHIEKARVPELLQKIKDKLNPGGVLYIAVKEKRGDGIEEEIKSESGYGFEYERFFSYYTMDELKEYYQQLGLDVVWESSVGFSSTQWLQIIGRKKG